MNQEEKRLVYEPEELKAQKDREDKARVKREKEMADIRDVLSTPGGRRFIWRLLAESNTIDASFVPGQYDMTAFKEGQRDIGLKILLDIEEAKPGIYAQITNEIRSAAVDPQGARGK